MNSNLKLFENAKKQIADGISHFENAIKIIDTIIGMEAAEDEEIDSEERELMNKSAPGTVGGGRG